MMKQMNSVKKCLMLLTSLWLAAAMLASCGADKAANISMYDLYQSMSGASDQFTDMLYASSNDANPADLFENISDMDYGKVNAFFVYYAAQGAGNADEIAVIQVKKKADLNEAAASLEAHLEKRRKLYATYDKSQLSKLEKGRVVTKNGIAALIVADDADKIENAFYQFVG